MLQILQMRHCNMSEMSSVSERHLAAFVKMRGRGKSCPYSVKMMAILAAMAAMPKVDFVPDLPTSNVKVQREKPHPNPSPMLWRGEQYRAHSRAPHPYRYDNRYELQTGYHLE